MLTMARSGLSFDFLFQIVNPVFHSRIYCCYGETFGAFALEGLICFVTKFVDIGCHSKPRGFCCTTVIARPPWTFL